MDSAADAEQWVAQGDQELNGKCWLWRKFFITDEERAEKALDCYERAATQYRIQKQWDDAGQLYARMASLCAQYQMVRQTEFMQQASKCWAHSSPAKACDILQRCATLQQEEGRLRSAARDWSELAGLYEKQGDAQQALDAWTRAQKAYEAESATASALMCMRSRAALMALQGDLKSSAAVFAEAGKLACEADRTGASDLFYRALLATLAHERTQSASTPAAGSCEQTAAAMERFLEICPPLDTSREYKFVTRLLQALQKENDEAVREAVRQYDSVRRLSQWETKMLLLVQDGSTPRSRAQPHADAYRDATLQTLAGGDDGLSLMADRPFESKRRSASAE